MRILTVMLNPYPQQDGVKVTSVSWMHAYGACCWIVIWIAIGQQLTPDTLTR